MAAPSKLTDEIQRFIVEQVENGVPQEAAALTAGINPGTLYRWKTRGDPDRDGYNQKTDRRYREFREAVEAARGRAESSYALLVRRAAQGGDTRAAMWWLDRAHPERWAQRKALELSGGETPLRIQVEWEDA